MARTVLGRATVTVPNPFLCGSCRGASRILRATVLVIAVLLLACGNHRNDHRPASADGAVVDGSAGISDAGARLDGAVVDGSAGISDAGARLDGAVMDDGACRSCDDGGFDAAVDLDGGRSFPLVCSIVAGPRSAFDSCTAMYCDIALSRVGDRWLAAYGSRVQVLDHDGVRVGTPMDLVDGDGVGGQPGTRLAPDGDTGFWSLWEERETASSSGSHVWLGRFALDGTRLMEREVGPNFSHANALASSASGVAAWWSQGYASGQEGIYVQGFGPDGLPLGGPPFAHLTSLPSAGIHGHLIDSAGRYVGCRATADGLWWYGMHRTGLRYSRDFLDLMTPVGEHPQCTVAEHRGSLFAIHSGDGDSLLHGVTDGQPPTLVDISLSAVELGHPAGTSLESATITSNGTLIGLAYRYHRTPGNLELYFTVIDEHGEVLAAPVRLWGGRSLVRPQLAAAADGSFGIAWQEGLSFARVACSTR